MPSWDCPKCTFSNDGDRKACEMCDTARPSKNKTKSRSRSKSPSGGKDGKLRSPTQLQRKRSRLGSGVRKSDFDKAKLERESILKKCKANNEKFTDEEFPPKPKSLFFNGKKPMNTSLQYSDQAYNEKVEMWLRPGEFFESQKCKLKWFVFREPKASDIIQGVLGNCWLLSSLAVLAEKREFLEQLFPVAEHCETGVYQVRLYQEGTWTIVTVDDLLPCDDRKRLIYSDCSRRQLWVPIIEKACAKLFGCYEALVAGKCVEGLSLLTGAPCETISLQQLKHEEKPDHETIWGQMISFMEAGDIMGASCGGGQMQVDEKAYEEYGLKPRHAYSVLDVRLVNKNRLIRLRNPWGKFSWKGAWSDDSSQMKVNMKDKLLANGPAANGPAANGPAANGPAANGPAEGVFWMEYDDFSKFFDSIDICRINHDWELSKISGILPSLACTSQHMAIMTIYKSTEAVITLFQKNNRHQNMSKCMDLNIVVCSCNEKNFAPNKVITNSRRQLKSFVSCTHVFEPGMYMVLPMAFNHYNGDQKIPSKEEVKKMPNFTMTFHSMAKITVDRFYIETYTLADALWLMAQKKGVKHEGRKGMTVYYLSGGWAGLVIGVENRDPDLNLQIKCNCNDSFNVVATRGDLLTMDVIPPLHRQIIVVLTQLEISGGHQINHKLTHRTSSEKDLDNWAKKGETNVPALMQTLWGLHAARPL